MVWHSPMPITASTSMSNTTSASSPPFQGAQHSHERPRRPSHATDTSKFPHLAHRLPQSRNHHASTRRHKPAAAAQGASQITQKIPKRLRGVQAAPYTLRRASARLCKLRHRRARMCVPPRQGPVLAEGRVIAIAFAVRCRDACPYR